MTLNTDWLFKLSVRKKERHAKERRPGKPPAAVIDKQDEGAVLLRRMKEKRATAMSDAIDAHPEFNAFMEKLAAHEPEFNAPIRGVLDVDLAELALRLGVDSLPHAVKFLAVEEVHACVRRVNKRQHGKDWDEIPWCLPKDTRFTLEEFKEAIGIR